MARLNFPHRKSILPVIHCESTEQTLRNTRIALEGGCDGVFLINHRVSAKTLLQILDAAKEAFPDAWIGANFLGLPVVDVLRTLPLEGIDGIWTDNACVDERRDDQPEADGISQAIGEANWKGAYFGGVAFKYQRPVDDLAGAARIASGYMDVVCTSGPGTGHAADVDKLRTMCEALKAGTLLAVASGITPENVSEALPFVDIFMVATGISHSFTELDPSRVASLVNNVRQYESRHVSA